MIAERTYMLPPRTAPAALPSSDRLFDGACELCDGQAFYQSSIARPDGVACPKCDGIATIGVFVVHIKCARFKYEQRFETPSLAHAIKRAERTATLFANRKCLGQPVQEVRVVFKCTPFRGSKTIRVSDEIVVSVPVVARSRTAA